MINEFHHTELAAISAGLKYQKRQHASGKPWLKFSIDPKNGLQCGAKQQARCGSCSIETSQEVTHGS